MVITMSEDNFLKRWSQRKRDVVESEKATSKVEARDVPTKPGEEGRAVGAAGEGPQPEFDLASLPPIESINALTDVTAFLRPGVPADLTRAALRRVWTADPAIRDFVGLAENAWDFTDPNAMPGFGTLEATEEVRRMIAQVVDQIGQSARPEADKIVQGTTQITESPSDFTIRQSAENREEVTPAVPAAIERIDGAASGLGSQVLLQGSKENTAMQHDVGEDVGKPKQSSLRTHGRALPR